MLRLAVVALVVALAPGAASQVALHEAHTERWPGDLPARTPAGFIRTALPDGDSLLVGPVILEIGPGAITDVSVGREAFTGAPALSVTFAQPEAFAALTATRVGQALALVVDGAVWMAPTVQGAIPNGRLQVTGQFAPGELDVLAGRLREVTGAADPTAAARQAMAAAGPARSPEEAATTFLRAVAVGAWVAAARQVHPDLRPTEEDIADLDRIGDVVWWEGHAVSIGTVLPEVANPAGPLDDIERMALVLALAPTGMDPDWRLVGSVADGADRAVVVVRPSTPDEGTDFYRPTAIPVRSVNGVWYVVFR